VSADKLKSMLGLRHVEIVLEKPALLQDSTLDA
jgi:hypothetical protein